MLSSHSSFTSVPVSFQLSFLITCFILTVFSIACILLLDITSSKLLFCHKFSSSSIEEAALNCLSFTSSDSRLHYIDSQLVWPDDKVTATRLRCLYKQSFLYIFLLIHSLSYVCGITFLVLVYLKIAVYFDRVQLPPVLTLSFSWMYTYCIHIINDVYHSACCHFFIPSNIYTK